ncbi:MAG: signal peptidase I [Parcubacteria group bacterium]|jgi:signal peptidase I
MNIKDIKKAGINDAEKIRIKEIDIKEKGKETKIEEINIEREEAKFKKIKNKFHNFFKKFWFLLWKDDSIKGWIFSILFLFIFIKLIFFPLLSLATSTSLPLAIVESCSMYHQGNLFSNYDSWFTRHNEKYSDLQIDKTEFSGFPFTRGFNKGDILFITGVKPENVKVGEVIIFNANSQNPIIHRVISIKQQGEKYYFSTIGDNNNGQISFEKSISQDQLIGRASFRLVPYLGWIKLIFFEGSRNAEERGFCSER